MYPITPLVQVFSRLLSITIEYPNKGFNLYSLTFVVPIYTNFIPPSHHTVLWKFLFLIYYKVYSSVNLSSVFGLLTIISVNIADMLSNKTRGACYVTIFGYLFINSLLIIRECDRSVTAVHAALYSVSALDWENVPVTCVRLSTGPPL